MQSRARRYNRNDYLEAFRLFTLSPCQRRGILYPKVLSSVVARNFLIPLKWHSRPMESTYDHWFFPSHPNLPKYYKHSCTNNCFVVPTVGKVSM